MRTPWGCSIGPHYFPAHRQHLSRYSLQPTAFTCHLLKRPCQGLIYTWGYIGPWDPTYYKDEEGAPKQVCCEPHDIEGPNLQGGSHLGCSFPEWPSLESPAHCSRVHSRVLGCTASRAPLVSSDCHSKAPDQGSSTKAVISHSPVSWRPMVTVSARQLL